MEIGFCFTISGYDKGISDRNALHDC